MVSCRGTALTRPAADQRRRYDAPGNQGMVASTSTSQSSRRAANCWRLNGDESGSTAFGKSLVITSARTPSPGRGAIRVGGHLAALVHLKHRRPARHAHGPLATDG